METFGVRAKKEQRGKNALSIAIFIRCARARLYAQFAQILVRDAKLPNIRGVGIGEEHRRRPRLPHTFKIARIIVVVVAVAAAATAVIVVVVAAAPLLRADATAIKRAH